MNAEFENRILRFQFDLRGEITAKVPESAIVILSTHAYERLIDQAKRIGARAYVAKTKVGRGARQGRRVGDCGRRLCCDRLTRVMEGMAPAFIAPSASPQVAAGLRAHPESKIVFVGIRSLSSQAVRK